MTNVVDLLVTKLRAAKHSDGPLGGVLSAADADLMHQAADEIERLRGSLGDKKVGLVDALQLCLVAGNHLGTHKKSYWPPSDADADTAMKALIKVHGMEEYDMWTAWALIMRAAAITREVAYKAPAA